MRLRKGLLLSPHSLVFNFALALLFLYIVVPFGYDLTSLAGVLVIWAFVAVFCVSSILACSLTTPPGERYLAPEFDGKCRRLFWLLLVISLVGVLARIVSNFYIRGFDLSQGSAALRLSLQTLSYDYGVAEVGQAGMVGALAALFIGFTYPLIVFLIYFWSDIRRSTRRLAVAISLYPAIEGFLLGGSWAAAFTFLFFFFSLAGKSLSLPSDAGARLVPYPRLMTALAIAIVAVGGFLFIDRVELIFGSKQQYLELTSLNSFIKPSETLFDLVAMPIIGNAFFVFFWLVDYLVQGTAEFSYLIDRFNAEDRTHGVKQFFVIFKFLSLFDLVDFDMVSIATVNPRPGRYQTFLGDAYIDFGLVGLLLEGAILGWISGYLYLSSRRNQMLGILLYPFFASLIISGFMVNAFSGGRFYFLVALIITAFLSRVIGVRRVVR